MRSENILYWPNGQMKRKCQFEKGIRHGVDQMWSESGVLLDEGTYDQGKAVGHHRRWNEAGQLLEEIEHLIAPRFNLRQWDDKGNLRTEALWKDESYEERVWDRFQKIWIEKKQGNYETNLTLFQERFPRLALLAPQWEAKVIPEAKRVELTLEKVEVLYIHGIRSHYPKEWLEKNVQRQLVFLVEEEGEIASWLKKQEMTEILSSPQIHIFLRPTAEELAQRFPVKRIEVIGGKKSFRLQLLRKTTLSHALYLDRLHGYQPFQNFVKNVRYLPESFYANGLKNAFKDVPAVVCGAGPSLQKSMDVLRTLENKALLIAGGSTLAALSSQGVMPHFGMAIDPNLEEYRRLRNSFAFEVPLLYSTRVFPAIFQTCNGPFGYMRSGIGGVPELWMEEELGLLDPLLGDFLSDESISVTAICIAWAQFLGCNPILLNGVDLAYTGKKRYASGVAEDEDVPFAAIDAEKSAADRILERKDRHGQPLQTAVRWIMEAASLSHFARKHRKVRFLNTTDGGLPLQGIDYMPLADALSQFPKQNIRERVQKAIAASPMPPQTKEVVAAKMDELRESLDRIVSHLGILAGKSKGSTALAEMEMREEMAYPYLFYDALSLFREDKWGQFLDLATKYQAVLRGKE